ncbi:MAG: hypothetical protein ACFB2W_15415 [Leptolyngbyaceae cyanobacterium]
MSFTNPKSVVRIEKTFENVLSFYRWHIKYLCTDKDAIRIEYEITPPVFIPDKDDVLMTLTSTWGHALDNLGNEYQSAGGAIGLSKTKNSTEGVISFVPLPDVEATSIQFFIEIKRGEKGPDSIEFSASLSETNL